MSSTNLTEVDWSTIPAPVDDGATKHLIGMAVPPIKLPGTDGSTVLLSKLSGTTVIYIYPMTGRPDRDLPDGWNEIPGARGCTPQSCSFRDHFDELKALGVTNLFGLSTQGSSYQREAVGRLKLPFHMLSDEKLKLTQALELPTFESDGQTLIKRMTLILRDKKIAHVFYPVFPPDRSAADVIAWLGEGDWTEKEKGPRDWG